MTATSLPEVLDRLQLDVLILGFPKCGTTSFADWLSKASGVSVSHPKETYVLCPEYKETVGEPNRFFEAGDGVRVEASTLNVYSSALRDALQTRRNVKAFLLFRDPSDAVVSWHRQMINSALTEHANLQSALFHATGAVDTPQFLKNYPEMVAYDRWIESWLKALGHERLFLIDMSELSDGAPSLRQAVARFLPGVELLEQPDNMNSYHKARFEVLYSWLRNSSFNRKLMLRFTRAGPLRRFKLLLKDRVFRSSGAKETLPADQRARFEGIYPACLSLRDENRAFWAEQ